MDLPQINKEQSRAILPHFMMNKTILSLLMLLLGVIIGFNLSRLQGGDTMAVDSSAIEGSVKHQLFKNQPDALYELNRETGKIAAGEANKAKAGSEAELQGQKGDVKSKSPDEVLLEILVAIRTEQEALRAQIAESNRDIDELTFRVDTHSDSFRPLNTLNQRPRAIEVPDEEPVIEVDNSLPIGP